MKISASFYYLCISLLLLCFTVSGCATYDLASGASIEPEYIAKHASKAGPLDVSFFKDCAFISVDIQNSTRPDMASYQMPKGWRDRGFSIEDVTAAIDYEWDVARPNAAKVAHTCRKLGLKMIFIHWGYLFEDAADLDPATYTAFYREYGTAYEKWPHHISRPDSRPAGFFKVRPGDYVIAKTAQDAFPSSNLEYVLCNLGIKDIVFVGGHTGACLGKTAASARKLQFRTLCVKDATFDARQSTWFANIQQVGYDHVVNTDQFLSLADLAMIQKQ